MAIIAISKGSYTRGKEVAEKVAEKLGYECVSRDSLLEASETFNAPAIRLIRETTSIMDQAVFRKDKYVSYIRASILRHLQKDNVVYHGFCIGHIFTREVTHLLRIRIIADLDDRVRIVMARDGVTRNEALRFLQTMDAQRRKWGQQIHGVDIWDTNLYDLVINASRVSSEGAAEIICDTVALGRFQSTPESQKAIDELLASAEAKISRVSLLEGQRISSMESLMGV